MFQPDQYELIDFGDGEKLERFGDHIVRRQSPSVLQHATDKRGWKWDLQFARQPQPSWSPGLPDGPTWSIKHSNKLFLLKQAPSGQVGVFPEQADNWDWINSHRERLRGMKAINLFAYTGGTTMQLADCGVEVTHVDSAKPVVRWARHNAEVSDLSGNNIRWIVEDAVTYLRREAKRNNQYQIVIADPPSLGRGPKGAVWKIQRDLQKLFKLFRAVADDLQMMIVSCHTPEVSASDLKRLAIDNVSIDRHAGEAIGLQLKNRHEKTLDSGQCFRWSAL